MSNEIHVCPVCDYVYENDPDRTCSWEELPHDYLCPACSVEKEWFQTQYL
jgi:rubredoxin